MNIENYRKEIDKLDKQIVSLLNKRAKFAAKIGEAKKKSGHKIYVPEREIFILNRIAEINKGPLSDASIKAIYREIMSASIALEKPLKIAIFAKKDLLSFFAGYSRFGHSAEYIQCKSLSTFFKKIEADEFDYGICPVLYESGKISTKFLDLLSRSQVKICAEINANLNYLEWTDTESNRTENKFLLFGKQDTKSTGNDKTWLRLILKNDEEKSLAENTFYKYNLESKILNITGAYGKTKKLYIEVSQHISNKQVQLAVEELRASCKDVKNLGSYPIISG